MKRINLCLDLPQPLNASLTNSKATLIDAIDQLNTRWQEYEAAAGNAKPGELDDRRKELLREEIGLRELVSIFLDDVDKLRQPALQDALPQLLESKERIKQSLISIGFDESLPADFINYHPEIVKLGRYMLTLHNRDVAAAVRGDNRQAIADCQASLTGAGD